MSLLEGLLEDALLEGIALTETYIVLRDDAPTTGATFLGTGTYQNPYGGHPSNPDWFDALMLDSSRIMAGTSINLGPGTFLTKGFSVTDGTGWSPRDGVRIKGQGVGVTTLRLTGIPANKMHVAVGINFATTSLDGFELSDLTIDCNFANNSNSGITAAGIRVCGKHVYLRRIRVINFGTKISGQFYQVITAASEYSENCIIDSCCVEKPDPNDIGNGCFLSFEGSTAHPHQFCVIRNCAIRSLEQFVPVPPISALNYFGILPGSGVGTIIEGNQIANMGMGIASGFAAKDLVIWNNFIRNAWNGIRLSLTSPDVSDRVVITDNIIELNSTVSFPEPTGILVFGASSGGFKEVVIKKNVIRDVYDPAVDNPALQGMNLVYCGSLVVEGNVIHNIPVDRAISWDNCDQVKFFNNQNNGGVLMRAWNETLQAYTQQLEDAVEDVMMPY